MEQLRLDEEWFCACWQIRDEEGRILACGSCPDCLRRALDFLEDVLEFDKVVSVSALETEAGDAD